jgi:lysophospholipase L1-like esterase
MVNILIFGDSIIYGNNDAKGGWATRLKMNLANENLTYVLGIPGDRTTWLLERFENEIKERFDEGIKCIMIIAVGLNDSCFENDKCKFAVPEKDFRKNIEKLTLIAKKYAEVVIFIGLTPINDKKTKNITKYHLTYKNEWTKRYDEIIKKLAEKSEVIYVPLFEKFNPKKFKDGLHPDSLGHKIIFDDVRDFLKKKKLI